MIPEKAIKKFSKPSHREIAVGILVSYGLFPQTNDGIDQAKKLIAGASKWISPSNLPEYYDGIDSDLITGRETPGILAIRETLKNFYFGTPTTTIDETPIEEIPVEVEIIEVEKLPDPVPQPDPTPEPVKIEIEVPVEKQANAPRRIKLPRAKNRFVRKKVKPLSQRMAESFDKNLLDPLIEEIKNPKPLPTSKTKKGGTKKQVSKKIFPGKQFAGKFSSSSGSLGPRVISKIGASFGLAAASRKAFKESGGDPRSLRRGYFLSKALGAEFGGDFRRRTRGTFSRDPDATQDPGMSKEERFAQVVKRDLVNRPQMMKQGEILDVDSYTNKTALQSITDLAKKTADKILGLEPGFVRIEKSQKETSKAFVKITQSLSEVKNTFVKTADNFKEFVDNKEEVIKIKTKIREVLRKEQDENKRSATEAQGELFQDTAGTTDVEETDQGLNEEEEQQQEDGGGGFDLPDFRRPRIRGRLRLARRRFSRFGRGFGRRLGGLGRGLGRIGSGIGRGLGAAGKFVGGRVLGPVLGDMLFPEGAGVSEPQMGPDGKFRTPDGKLVPEPGASKPKSVASRVGNLAESGKGLIGKGKGAIGKVAGKVGSKLGGGLAKSIGKKIPGVGLVIGGLAAADRFKSGDILGGIGEIGSGIASLVPGVGTAISLGIDALLMGKDVAAEASKPETKLSGGGIVAGEAGNEAVIPLTSSIGKKVVGGLENSGGGSILSAIGPLLSATAGIVRNPLYGSILGPVVNPIIQPMLAQYKVPVYSGDFGSFKISKLQAATTQAKGKTKSIEQASKNPLTSGMGWLGTMFSGIGGMVSGAFGGIKNFFGGLFGGGRQKRGKGSNVSGIPLGDGETATGSTIMNGLVKRGFTKEEAAAIVGNLWAESSFRTGAVNPKSGAFGLMQWAYGRKDTLMRRAAESGKSATDLEFQLDHIAWELRGGDRYETSQFKKAMAYGSDVPSKTRGFANEVERASDSELSSSMAKRIGAAESVYKKGSSSISGNNRRSSPSSSNNQDKKTEETQKISAKSTGASAAPKVAAAPMAKSDDSNLMASAAQLPTKSLAPSVMQDPDPDNEGYGNNLAIVAPSAGKVSPQMPRQTGGGGFVVMDQDPGLTIGGIINARLYNA
jgi:hypothetical protein